jgi:hypothetical protein
MNVDIKKQDNSVDNYDLSEYIEELNDLKDSVSTDSKDTDPEKLTPREKFKKRLENSISINGKKIEINDFKE